MKFRIIIIAALWMVSGALTFANAAPAGDQGTISGKVVETMNAASYTYVQVDTGKSKVWVAAPQVQVKVGDKVAVSEAMPMQNYHSKTLNRDFPMVYFAGGLTVNGKSGAAPAASSGAMPAMPANHPPIKGDKAAAPISVKKADGGQSVAEVFASKDKLKDKAVKIRGQVVKYNAEIMNRNWVHIQDGTGAAGSNDLLVTTQDKAKVGDTVLITGTLVTNKDFGSGYKYAVMVENAKVAVE